MAPETCPNCGADVPRNARACPECGADEQTGWSDEARHRGLDLPDEEFDYDEFVQREFGGPSPKARGISWLWWIIAIIVVLALLRMFIF